MSNSNGHLRDLTSASCDVAFILDAAKSARERVYYAHNRSFVPTKEREENITKAEAEYDAWRQKYFDAIRAFDDQIAFIAAADAEWEVVADGADAGRLMLAAAGAGNAWLEPEEGNGSSTLEVLVPKEAMERIDVFVQRMMTEE